jgi:hypothetical protein
VLELVLEEVLELVLVEVEVDVVVVTSYSVIKVLGELKLLYSVAIQPAESATPLKILISS